MELNNGIQTILKHIGDEGCYFLSILKAANYDGDIVQAYNECLNEGIIEQDCYVNDPIKLMNKYSYFNVSKVIKSNNIIDNPTVVIGQWEFGTYRHFALIEAPNYKHSPVWDPLEHSNCVNKGRLISYRLFY